MFLQFMCMMRKHGVAPVCIVTLLALTSGCASTPKGLELYEPQSVDSYKNLQIKDGLAVAIHPILDGEESKKYFGADLPSDNIFPVYFVAENRHPSSKIVLFKSSIVLRTEQFEATRAPDKPAPAQVRRGNSGSAGLVELASFYPPILILALPFALASAVDRGSAQDITNHLRTQEFQSRTLAPGQVARGFLYFQLPTDAKLPGRWTIHLESLEVVSQKITRFEFLFTSEGTTK